MSTKKALRGSANHNGAKHHKHIVSRHWRRRYQKMRERFFFGIFCAGVMGFLIGGAALDSDPAAAIALIAISFAVCAVLYVQNAGGRCFS